MNDAVEMIPVADFQQRIQHIRPVGRIGVQHRMQLQSPDAAMLHRLFKPFDTIRTVSYTHLQRSTPFTQRKYNIGGGTNSSDSSELVFLVFADEAAMLPVQDYLQEGEWETSTRIGVNYAGTLEDRTAFYEALNQKVRSLGPVQYATLSLIHI